MIRTRSAGVCRHSARQACRCGHSRGGRQAHSPHSPATTELGHPYPEPWPLLAGSTQVLLFPTYSVVCFRLWISSDWPCFQCSFSAPVMRKKFHPLVIYTLKDSRRTPWRWKWEIKELIFESPWDPGHRKWISECLFTASGNPRASWHLPDTLPLGGDRWPFLVNVLGKTRCESPVGCSHGRWVCVGRGLSLPAWPPCLQGLVVQEVEQQDVGASIRHGSLVMVRTKAILQWVMCRWGGWEISPDH